MEAEANDNILKVLIVVDVQNCFMNFILNPEDELSKNKETFLNLNSFNDSKNMANEIAVLTQSNDYIVFTKDFHPINHISFAGDENRTINPPNTWPHHCRNINKVCASRIITDSSSAAEAAASSVAVAIGELPNPPIPISTIMSAFEEDLSKFTPDMLASNIIGTDLSYFFYPTNIGQTVFELNETIGNTIGLNPNSYNKSDKETNFDDILWEDIEPLNKEGKKYIKLTKGELCNKESFSAFNYHINYNIEDPSKPEIDYDFNSIQKQNSTGLWEWIIKQSNTAIRPHIQITVCGLVGNVCVMHSVLQGKSMWDQIYQDQNKNKTATFTLSLIGTRFTTEVPPGNINPSMTDLLYKKKNPLTMTFHEWCNKNKPPSLKDDAFIYFSFLNDNGKPISFSGGKSKKTKRRRRSKKTKRKGKKSKKEKKGRRSRR